MTSNVQDTQGQKLARLDDRSIEGAALLIGMIQ
jgi:hypothetical protein